MLKGLHAFKALDPTAVPIIVAFLGGFNAGISVPMPGVLAGRGLLWLAQQLLNLGEREPGFEAARGLNGFFPSDRETAPRSGVAAAGCHQFNDIHRSPFVR